MADVIGGVSVEVAVLECSFSSSILHLWVVPSSTRSLVLESFNVESILDSCMEELSMALFPSLASAARQNSDEKILNESERKMPCIFIQIRLDQSSSTEKSNITQLPRIHTN